MEKKQKDKSLMEKYKIAWKGLSSNKPKPKVSESKKYPKSMEMYGVSTINQSKSKISAKGRSLLYRSKDKQVENLKHRSINQVRKTKSKPNYKPQTAQINLFNNHMLSAQQKQGMDIQTFNKNKDKLNNTSEMIK